MKIIFSNNSLIGSKWIRSLSFDGDISEVPSHVSFLFFDTFLLESAFPKGFRVNNYEYFKKQNKVVKVFESKNHIIDELDKMKNICNIYYGAKYDWKSVLFQGVTIVLKRYLGIDFSLTNKWDNASRYSCQELMAPLFPDRNLEMMTPNDLMIIIKESNEFKEV